MKPIRAVFFDLDGTLLPQRQEEFVTAYFSRLVKKLARFGVDPDSCVRAVWAGTAAMVKNNGEKTNEEVFWETFEARTHADIAAIKPVTDRFYQEEFEGVKEATRENKLAKVAVDAARKNGKTVILATNPLFPQAAQAARMRWVGLSPSDFDRVTAFEDSYYCKPNPKYYEALCKELHLSPEECLMVGNDEKEDLYASGLLGFQGFLVTDCGMIEDADHPWQGARGTFEELISFLKAL